MAYTARLEAISSQFLWLVGVPRGENERASTAIRRCAKRNNWCEERLRYTLEDLYEEMLPVYKEIALAAEEIFHSVDRMNTILAAAGRGPEFSKSEAQREFDTIYLNIFDAVDENYVFHDDLEALKQYSIPDKIFPLKHAKELGARYLLKPLLGGRHH